MFDSIEQIPGGSERMYNAPLSRIGTAYPLIFPTIRYRLDLKTGLFYDFRRPYLGKTLAVARHAGPIAMLHLLFETISSSTNPLAMFRVANVRLPTKAAMGSSRRLLAGGAGLLLLSLLTGCPQAPPTSPSLQQPPPLDAIEKDLRFDTRYLDSLDGPRSARTQRQMAILGQLKRLGMARSSGSMLKQPLDAKGPTSPNDSVFDSTNGGPLVGYPNRAAQLADIYRKIDSLKVLEHIPLTPH